VRSIQVLPAWAGVRMMIARCHAVEVTGAPGKCGCVDGQRVKTGEPGCVRVLTSNVLGLSNIASQSAHQG
jgi:hypothetical protein